MFVMERLSSASSWKCDCFQIDLRCFAETRFSFREHYMNCGRCIATFASGCKAHACLLKNVWRSDLSHVSTKSRLASCSGRCSEPNCLCVHLDSSHFDHWKISFVVCYDANCRSHAPSKMISRGISVPLCVVLNDMENCPCTRPTCTCIGYLVHPFHAAVHACRFYDNFCTVHYFQKLALRIRPQNPAPEFTLPWLAAVRQSQKTNCNTHNVDEHQAPTTNPLGNGTQVWKNQRSEQADDGEGGDEQFVFVTRLSTSDTTDQSS